MKANTKKYSFLQRNGLSIVLTLLFFIFLAGQLMAGWMAYNDERKDYQLSEEALRTYLHSGHFIGALFENWESEFLQMGMYVLLTVWLRQHGSVESKKFDELEEVDREPISESDSPWPVHKGGLILWLYSNSLSLAFLLLFLFSFTVHSIGSCAHENYENALTGKAAITWLNFIASSNFWFESFQNWQSEFLAVLSIVVLSIWLRQKGSPESKPVNAPHYQTGN